MSKKPSNINGFKVTYNKNGDISGRCQYSRALSECHTSTNSYFNAHPYAKHYGSSSSSSSSSNYCSPSPIYDGGYNSYYSPPPPGPSREEIIREQQEKERIALQKKRDDAQREFQNEKQTVDNQFNQRIFNGFDEQFRNSLYGEINRLIKVGEKETKGRILSDNFIQELKKQYIGIVDSVINNYIGQQKHINVVVIGQTGVGKSTLINSIIGENLAQTGSGLPVTKGIPKGYETGKSPFRLYDTQGIELSGFTINELVKNIKDLVDRNSQNPDTVIHSIWYCINGSSDRIQESEIESIRFLQQQYSGPKGLPVFAVITQSYDKGNTGIMNAIKQAFPDVKSIPIVALEKYHTKPYGIPELIISTLNETVESSVGACNHSVNQEFKQMINQNNMKLIQKLNSELPKPYNNGYSGIVKVLGELLLMCHQSFEAKTEINQANSIIGAVMHNLGAMIESLIGSFSQQIEQRLVSEYTSMLSNIQSNITKKHNVTLDNQMDSSDFKNLGIRIIHDLTKQKVSDLAYNLIQQILIKQIPEAFISDTLLRGEDVTKELSQSTLHSIRTRYSSRFNDEFKLLFQKYSQ